MVTTHSSYILGTMNNLLYANRISSKVFEAIENEIIDSASEDINRDYEAMIALRKSLFYSKRLRNKFAILIEKAVRILQSRILKMQSR